MQPLTKLCLSMCPSSLASPAKRYSPSLFLAGLVSAGVMIEVPAEEKSGNPGMYSRYESAYTRPYDQLYIARSALSAEELVPEVLNTILQLRPYEKPQDYPVIVYLSAEELSKKACGKPCGVLGHYAGGKEVYLDNRLKPELNPFDRSVLLHELVHYLQEANGSYQIHPELPANDAQCLIWLAREIEAYETQAKYLRVVDGPVKRALLPVGIHCH